VKISDNCGESWTRLFAGGDNGEGNFATHELMTELFIPSVSEDWCGSGYGAQCVQLDISEYANLGNMQIMFESYNYFGNNLYLDNILIGPLTNLEKNPVAGNINIFPNPSTGKVNIVLPNKSAHTEITVFDLQGSEIIKLDTHDNQQVFTTDLSEFGMGVYFIKVTNSNISVTEKVVLQ
jgi:hypothetical protein